MKEIINNITLKLGFGDLVKLIGKGSLATDKRNYYKKSLIINDFRSTLSKLECIENWFEEEEDSDLIESIIYEREALKARHRYILKQAKENHVTGDLIYKN